MPTNYSQAHQATPRHHDDGVPVVHVIDPGTLLTADELAARWKLSRPTLYRFMAEEGLPSLSIGRARRFRIADVDAWLAARSGRAS